MQYREPHLPVALLAAASLQFAPSYLDAAAPALTLREDLAIRAPYVLPIQETKTYYLYATHQDPETKRYGVQIYKSQDLESWSEGNVVFEIPDGTWADPISLLSAPEVHEYNGQYYLLATLSNPAKILESDKSNRPDLFLRATGIFVSDSPDGPFTPLSDKPHTPEDWMSRDGTFWVEDGQPWMVFCHDWLQVVDGTVELVPLAPDLSVPLAGPLTLFPASNAKWSRDMKVLAKKNDKTQPSGRVSEGPFLHRTKDGKLLMLWSSFGDDGYACGYATSRSDKVTGPWIPAPEPIYSKSGGHGMVFEAFDGRTMLALHAPNDPDEARAQFLEIEVVDDELRIKSTQEEPASTEPETNSTRKSNDLGGQNPVSGEPDPHSAISPPYTSSLPCRHRHLPSLLSALR